MKRLAFLGGTVGVSLAALLGLHLSQAADHADAPNLLTNPMADLNDVYAWMTSDGAKVNLALTVSPFDDTSRGFGPSVVYAFHVTSRPGFGMAGTESKVICKFADNTHGECWVVAPTGAVVDYVSGDFSVTTGTLSASRRVMVFAGRRSDPFFFNLGGFKLAVKAAEQKCGGVTTGTGSACPGVLTTDSAGCPDLDPVDAAGLRAAITTPPPIDVAPCAAGSADCFGNADVIAIVIQVDKTELLQGTDKLVSVWASTHAAP